MWAPDHDLGSVIDYSPEGISYARQPQKNAKVFVDDLLREVENLVVSLTVPQTRGEDTHWTRALKHWLNERGKEHGFRSIYTSSDGTSEFLLDFVWWCDESGKSPLGCEIEWGNSRDVSRNAGRVAEDFDKLLSFKSRCKLMVFDSRDSLQMQEDVVKELNHYLSEYGDHRTDEFYLLVDVAKKRHKGWQCAIQQAGRDRNLHFSEI